MSSDKVIFDLDEFKFEKEFDTEKGNFELFGQAMRLLPFFRRNFPPFSSSNFVLPLYIFYDEKLFLFFLFAIYSLLFWNGFKNGIKANRKMWKSSFCVWMCARACESLKCFAFSLRFQRAKVGEWMIAGPGLWTFSLSLFPSWNSWSNLSAISGSFFFFART